MSNSSQSGRVGRRDISKEQYWRELVERQAASDQSIRSFCSQEALDENGFYSWRRTIRQRDAPAKPSQTPAAFVPAVLSGPAVGESWLVIELSGGRVLRVPESISAARLAELMAALETRRSR
jgi:transposase-like protein